MYTQRGTRAQYLTARNGWWTEAPSWASRSASTLHGIKERTGAMRRIAFCVYSFFTYHIYVTIEGKNRKNLIWFGGRRPFKKVIRKPGSEEWGKAWVMPESGNGGVLQAEEEHSKGTWCGRDPGYILALRAQRGWVLWRGWRMRWWGVELEVVPGGFAPCVFTCARP